MSQFWSPKTQPSKANVRKRILHAQQAVDGAMDLIKANPKMGKSELVPLNNARSWLVDAMRRVS